MITLWDVKEPTRVGDVVPGVVVLLSRSCLKRIVNRHDMSGIYILCIVDVMS